jgi:hypothetical protein
MTRAALITTHSTRNCANASQSFAESKNCISRVACSAYYDCCHHFFIASVLGLALPHPASFGRKVIQRCEEISAKAGSIGVLANFILRRISGLTYFEKIPCAFINP